MIGMVPPPIPLFKVFVAPKAYDALAPVLHSGQLANGRQVKDFESNLATWLGVDSVVAINDASAALVMALHLAGVGPGDEVITSPVACAATIMPIANLFAKPIWCDIDPLTGMMDSTQIESLITPKTRAILCYHWSGDVADCLELVRIAKKHNIKLIEDANAALGAQYQQKRLGGVADYTVYSFYATKHITTAGEGAALLALNPGDLDAARRLRRFGIDTSTFRLSSGDLNPQFDIPMAGYNFPMNEIAATVGIAGLKHADEITARHRANGLYYEAALANVPDLQLLQRRTDSVSAYWTYSMLAQRRDDLIRKLNHHGIGAQRLHMRHDLYSCFVDATPVTRPGTAQFDAQNISIPCGWWVGDQERTRIIDCLRDGW
jgi:perosamine synthetase